MKQPLLFGSELAVLCLLALAFAASSGASAAKVPVTKPAVDLRLHPTAGNTAVDVSVGLYITNFVAIDETRESFEVGGFLTGQWQDPRLASTTDQGLDKGATRTFRTEDLWTPAIESANAISHTTNQYSLEADRNGTVTYRERFDAVLSNNYALRRFPFDSQVLRFEYQPFLSSVSQIRFAPKPLPGTGISPDQHTELAAWRLADLTYTTDKLTNDPFLPETHEALFQLVAKRRSGFYVWKIFLPLIMITLIPIVVFWIDVKEFDWILKIPITMLLSMVAFQFTITRDLPRIGYVTFLDAVFLASFAFCFLCTFEITAVYLLQKYGRRTLAVKLHTAGRWAYPAAYFGVLLILAIGFLA
jgi:Neurotransmitter-gated ion-channel ligand binding domain